MSAHEPLFPIGAWIRVRMPDLTFVGFTYLDARAGLSAKGMAEEHVGNASAPGVTLRLPMPGIPWEELDGAAVERLGLPETPDWLEFFGPQPRRGTRFGAWRHHPALSGRLHPQYRDDVQVVVHDGGPRMTEHRPELVWVRVSGMDGEVFTGKVLNQPHQLQTVKQGSEIQFVVPARAPQPLQVREKYLRERGSWEITPCDKCGLGELFDAPSDLLPVVFPDAPADAEMEMFSARCGGCGGVQVVRRRGASV
ncbi:DUF2314 domain-containing protein [Chondromyces apiculatus]|uniref:RNA binding protein n=1 Tax=Chondromyces apiculatus DSM 436 TaxID=1192034 RepID=A0A017T8G6_9BACT|nr:DUF2314 domain-containing protein [Chondromyces apiculatus]EYF05085.1 RNA binding protein [Chondromyces apiculatus DSM 436]